MGNFAAVYPLPAGEQLLVLLIDNIDHGPSIQYVSEINGVMVSADAPLVEPGDRKDYLKVMAAKEEARMMISCLDDEMVKDIRRRLVRDVGGADVEFTKEDIQCQQPN